MSIIVSMAYAQLEPGTNFSTATEIQEGEYIFFLDRGAVHFFKIKLQIGDTLIATLRMPRRQDFDIILFSPLREVIEQGIRPAELTERVGTIASEEGYYYIVVYGFGGSSGSYTLNVDVIKPRVETITVKETITTLTTDTITSYVAYTITHTVEKPITVVSTRVEEVESLPWQFFGLIALAFALIYIGSAVSKASREENGQTAAVAE